MRLPHPLRACVLAAATLAVLVPSTASAMNLIPEDQSVQGSQCLGIGCTGTEGFGFEQLKLKDNNTRVLFDDTSAVAGVPSNDWQLVANDSNSGGANKFSIEDVTGARTPFTVRAGAPTDSIFAASSGNVGFGTSNPAQALQATRTDTPALRLEQTSG